VGYLRFAEARGVVFERQEIVLFVHAKAAEAVGVGEFAEALELLDAQRGVQGERDFEKCHGLDYSSGGWRGGTHRKQKMEIGKWEEAAGGCDG